VSGGSSLDVRSDGNNGNDARSVTTSTLSASERARDFSACSDAASAVSFVNTRPASTLLSRAMIAAETSCQEGAETGAVGATCVGPDDSAFSICYICWHVDAECGTSPRLYR
jgi:hypothetical protein